MRLLIQNQTMGEISEHRCAVSRKDRFLLYVPCTATLILVGATFCLFALHQIRIDQIEARINDMQDKQAKINSVGNNADGHAIDVLHRYAREALSGKVDSKGSTDMDKLVEEMINMQVTKTTISTRKCMIYIYIYIYIYRHGHNYGSTLSM